LEGTPETESQSFSVIINRRAEDARDVQQDDAAVLVLVTGTGEEVVPYFYKLVVGEGDAGI